MSGTGTLQAPRARAAARRPSSAPGLHSGIEASRHGIEARLASLALRDGGSGRLGEAMHYALLAPGKRLRPLICVLSAGALGNSGSAALDAGCALEMVHTASLIFDDLPAMDDATTRRGISCTHRVFGEGTAILAGISLLNRAFAIVSGLRGVEDGVRNRLVRELARAVGPGGLSGGQQLDLTDRCHCSDIHEVEAMNHLKTGVLFVAAARMGGMIAGGDGTVLDGLGRYGLHFGRAFQSADDILDMVASPEEAGKDTGKDAARPSVASLAGTEAARRRIERDLDGARQALSDVSLARSPLAVLLDGFMARVPS